MAGIFWRRIGHQTKRPPPADGGPLLPLLCSLRDLGAALPDLLRPDQQREAERPRLAATYGARMGCIAPWVGAG